MKHRLVCPKCGQSAPAQPRLVADVACFGGRAVDGKAKHAPVSMSAVPARQEVAA